MFEHLLHTNMYFLSILNVTHESVIWPNPCYTQKYDIKMCLHLIFIYENV